MRFFAEMRLLFYFLSLLLSSVSGAAVVAEENCINVEAIELNEDFCNAIDFYLNRKSLCESNLFLSEMI